MDFTSIIKKGIKKAKGLKTETLNNTLGSAVDTAKTLKDNAVVKKKQAENKINNLESKTYLSKDMYAKDDNYVTDKAHRKSVNRGLYAGSINSAKEDIKESKKSIATATDLQGKVEKVAKSKKKK